MNKPSNNITPSPTHSPDVNTIILFTSNTENVGAFAVLEYSYSYSYSSTTRVHASTRPVLDYQYSKFIWTWPVLDFLYSNFGCTRTSSTRYSAPVLESIIRVQRLIVKVSAQVFIRHIVKKQ